MTTHDYQTIAKIVGADKVDALREAGVDIADKPTKPTTDLFGRWAKHPAYGDVLITVDEADEDGVVWFAFLEYGKRGQLTSASRVERLTFPEETTRPEDVPVGETWLVNVDDGEYSAERINAVKIDGDRWVIGSCETIAKIWENHEVTLIAPLVPARPQDAGRDGSVETVTTEEEYAALPTGSVVANPGTGTWLKGDSGAWRGTYGIAVNIAGLPRRVLRRGWGE